jgi:hypothetical protein
VTDGRHHEKEVEEGHAADSPEKELAGVRGAEEVGRDVEQWRTTAYVLCDLLSHQGHAANMYILCTICMNIAYLCISIYKL